MNTNNANLPMPLSFKPLTYWIEENRKLRSLDFHSTPLETILATKVDAINVSYLCKAPAGTGKTSAILNSIGDLNPMVVHFYTPNHRLGIEVEEKLKQNYPPTQVEVVRVHGRAQLYMCDRIGAVKEVARLGLSVQRTLCKNGDEVCPYFDTCGYQKQFRQIEQIAAAENPPLRVFVMPHAYLTRRPSQIPAPDFVIIDEAHWQSVCKSETLKRKSAEKLVSLIAAKSLKHGQVLSAVLQTFENTSPQALKAKLKEQGIKPGDLRLLATFLGVLIEEYTKDISPDSDTAGLKLSRPAVRAMSFFSKALPVLADEMEGGRKTVFSLTYNAEKERFESYRLENFAFSSAVPLLLLDASADLEILKLLHDRSFQIIDAPQARNAHIIQCDGKSFSAQSITGQLSNGVELQGKRLEEVQSTLRGIAELIREYGKAGKGAVIATKRVIKPLKDWLPGAFSEGHFGNLRGSNAYENCNWIIVIGREQPPAYQISKYLRCFAASRGDLNPIIQDEYISGSHILRTVTGYEYIQRKVPEYIDPLGQRLLNQIREQEILQAVDRLRLIHNRAKKQVLILSNLDLGIPLDECWTFDEICAGGSALRRAFDMLNPHPEIGAAFPLGKSELHRLLPDLWSTPASAKSYLKGWGEKGVEPQIIYYMGSDPLKFRVMYRRAGQRGSAHAAIVSCAHDQIRTVLERVMGPGTRIETIQPIKNRTPNQNHTIDLILASEMDSLLATVL